MNVTNIFKNYSLSTESYEYPHDDKLSIGGAKLNEPNGGFLPIYICENESVSETTDDNDGKREYKTHKQSVSIKTLMEMRRKKNPLVQ